MLQASLEIKESHYSVLKLLGDYACCLQAKAVAIGPKRPLKIVTPIVMTVIRAFMLDLL
jgi:hypothetical protein